MNHLKYQVRDNPKPFPWQLAYTILDVGAMHVWWLLLSALATRQHEGAAGCLLRCALNSTGNVPRQVAWRYPWPPPAGRIVGLQLLHA